MECDEARAVLSAAADGEAAPAETAEAGMHAAACPDCAAWRARLHGLNRALRIEEASVTDLSAPILAEWDRVHPPRPERRLVRLGLVAVGVVNLFLSLPLLFMPQTGDHAGRELGAFGIGLAAAFLLAARDGTARGRLGIVATIIGLLVVTGLTDLLHAETAPHYELAHVPSIVGLALLWLLSRSEPAGGARPRPGRQVTRRMGRAA